jgi:hypothetical protein
MAVRLARPSVKDGETMSGSGDKPKESGPGKPPVKNDDKSKKSPAQVSEDDDFEDGDIATPKRDRDDEQQGL